MAVRQECTSAEEWPLTWPSYRLERCQSNGRFFLKWSLVGVKLILRASVRQCGVFCHIFCATMKRLREALKESAVEILCAKKNDESIHWIGCAFLNKLLLSIINWSSRRIAVFRRAPSEHCRICASSASWAFHRHFRQRRFSVSVILTTGLRWPEPCECFPDENLPLQKRFLRWSKCDLNKFRLFISQ